MTQQLNHYHLYKEQNRQKLISTVRYQDRDSPWGWVVTGSRGGLNKRGVSRGGHEYVL